MFWYNLRILTKNMKKIAKFSLFFGLLLGLFIIFFVAFSNSIYAHPGRTSSDGCHYCRTNCDSWGVPWNERHCHNGYTTPTTPNPTPTPTPTPKTEQTKVTEIIDGDTIKISTGEKVRFIGIDTPETKDPRKPVECFGKEASEHLLSKIDQKDIRLETDPQGDTIDKYGRILRYVYLDDKNINATMIKDGYAYAYTTYPFSKSEEFKNLENDAKMDKRGLWEDNTCNGKREMPTLIASISPTAQLQNEKIDKPTTKQSGQQLTEQPKQTLESNNKNGQENSTIDGLAIFVVFSIVAYLLGGIIVIIYLLIKRFIK